VLYEIGIKDNKKNDICKFFKKKVAGEGKKVKD